MALAPLVHVEQELGLNPDAVRRLAVLAASDESEVLRLSKPNAKRLEVLKTEATGTMAAAALGYRYGVEAGFDIIALRAAFLGDPPDSATRQTLEQGAAAQFPVTAQDLMQAFEGKALGEQLKALEARWIASGFALTKDQLLG